LVEEVAVLRYSPAEERLARTLTGGGLAAALLSVLTLLGAHVGPWTGRFGQPPWVSNTVAGLAVLGLLGWFAGADVRRFRALARLQAAGLAIGAVALAALAVGPATGGKNVILLVAAGVCAVADCGLIVMLRAAKPAPAVLPWLTEKPPTLPERIACVVFGLFGIGSLVVAVALLIPAFIVPINPFFTEPLFVGGSTVKIALLGVLGLTAAADVRRQGEPITFLITAHAVSFIAALWGYLGVLHTGAAEVTAFGMRLSTGAVMRGVVFSDLGIVVVFTVLKLAIGRALFDYLGYLTPGQFRTIEALHECLIRDPVPGVDPYEGALRVDRYLSAFPSSRLIVTRLALIGLELMPLGNLQPPLSMLAPHERRRLIDRCYRSDLAAVEGRVLLLDLIRTQLQAILRIGMQAAYIGYYSDPRVQTAIGFVPFSRRHPEYQPLRYQRTYPRLVVTTPNDVRQQGLDVIRSADVVIIGSGAAGAILAEQLLARGRDVIMLEKGLHLDRADFTEDEVHQISRLYGDGALQLSQSYRFQILQGSCVGGGTTINNAVCFDTPERVLTAWNDPQGASAGIDIAAFRRSQAAVKERLAIRSITESSSTRPWPDVLNPGDRMIAKGIEAIGLRPGDAFEVVRANITDCLGCGYCNIGCQFGRKLSMLDEVLPRAQRDHGADRLRIFSEAEVVRLNGNGRTVTEVVVRLRDGRQLLIQRPTTVVVSAGAIHSSWLLMQSGIGRGELPIGRHLCFNMGSPLHGYWSPVHGQHLNSYAGLQIAHYLDLGDEPGFVYETWFNPPVAQALAMPGWLDRHERNMRRYADLAAVGVLVGTEATAVVTPALILRGTPDVVYRPSARDLTTLVRALTFLGEIMFAGGATEVMASAMSDREEAIFRRPEDLRRLARIVRDDRDIVLGTGHPQGGNAISTIRGRDRGVVDPDLKVYGCDNLYVCDASVFPSATTVNPQLTVMTFAHYAAERIR